MEQRIQFCKTADDVRIAYAVSGNGPPCLWLGGWVTDLEGDLEHSFLRRLMERYVSDFTVIRYDKRGMGLSDRDARDYSIKARLLDLEAVITDLKIDKFVMRASSDGTPTAIVYAAEHAQSVESLILFAPFASGARLVKARGNALEALASLLRIDSQAAAGALITLMHGDVKDSAFVMKTNAGPETADALAASYATVDVTDYLPRIRSKTLVIHSRQDRIVPFEHGREVAAAIPGAQFFAYDGEQLPSFAVMDEVSHVVRGFLGLDPVLPPDVVEADAAPNVRTVLFTDLVGHSEMMSRLGDQAGRDVLREHEDITRNVLKQHGGTEVKTMGDGFMASFGSVTKAVECAVALQRAFADREGEPLNVRVGLNAGEPIEEDGDLFGATVILASRIAAKADAGEILVADTVRGLCSGKGFLFSDRGNFVAKGIEEPVRISEVNWRHA